MDDNLEEILEECSVNSSSFKNLQDRLRFNNTISQYYDMLYDEEFRPYEFYSGDEKHRILRISDRVRSCSHEWDVAFRKNLKVKQLVKTNLCRDKFCIKREFDYIYSEECEIVEKYKASRKVLFGYYWKDYGLTYNNGMYIETMENSNVIRNLFQKNK